MMLAAAKTDRREKAMGRGDGGAWRGQLESRRAAEVSAVWPLTRVSVCTSQVNYSLVVRLQNSSLEQCWIN